MRGWFGRRLLVTSALFVAVAWAVEPAGMAEASVGVGGTQLWASSYDGPGSSDDSARSVDVSHDGSVVYVTGYSTGDKGNLDYATIAYDTSTGVEVWKATFNGSGNNDDAANSIAVSPDGSVVFVTGSIITNDGQDFGTVAYDATTGSMVWSRRYDAAHQNDVAVSIAVAPDGLRVFVTGVSYIAGNADYATVSYDSMTGDVLWGTRYDDPGHGFDGPTRVAVSPNGSRVFVTGQGPDPIAGSCDYLTVGYDATTGSKLWVKHYGNPDFGCDKPSSVAVSGDGSTVVVTGTSWNATTYYDYATVAYNAASGAFRWLRRYSGVPSSIDGATSVAPSPDGSKVFVTGSSYGPTGDSDAVTIAYDVVTGSTVWIDRFDGPSHDYDAGSDAVVSPDGLDVFVIGMSYGPTGTSDFTTLAYDALKGSLLWNASYDGSGHGNDVGNSVTVSPDGSGVFVTGSATGASTGKDYATVAYGAFSLRSR